MRSFDYTRDHGILGTKIKHYIDQLIFEIKLMNEKEPNAVYDKALVSLSLFNEKYKDLFAVQEEILRDLLKPSNVEYCYKNKQYPKDASKIGMEIEEDLKKIFRLEEELKLFVIDKWKHLTRFEDIKNGEKFMAVGHASHLIPGTANTGMLNLSQALYLSCSLFSDRELNTYSNIKTVYLIDVDENNYIASSYVDTVTADFFFTPQFETMKEIDINGKKHYIKVGYSILGKEKSVTAISTPELIEKLSIERELERTGTLYSYGNSLTNEIVLDRTTSKVSGALLISDGCDLLIDEYRRLKESNIRFKCINKGVYRKQSKLPEYDKEQYDELLKSLKQLLLQGKYDVEFLKNYYTEVVIPMSYNKKVKDLIEKIFTEYYDLHSKIQDNSKTIV